MADSSVKKTTKRKSSAKKAPPEEPVFTTGMRRFLLVRDEDHTGMSGVGVVAEGVQFTKGSCVITWKSEFDTVTHYPQGIVALETLHTHSYQHNTRVVWVDPKPGDDDSEQK